MSFYSYFYLLCFVDFDPRKNMYHTIAKNLFEFREMYDLPTALKKRLASLPSPEELSKLLMDKRQYFTNHALVCIINKSRSIKEKATKNKALKPRVPAEKWQDLVPRWKTFWKIVSFVKSWIPNKSYMKVCQYLLAIAWRLWQKTLTILNCLESLVRETWSPQKQNITTNAFWTYLIVIASIYEHHCGVKQQPR